MHCEECGLTLDGVDDSEILKSHSKYTKPIAYCPKHASEILGSLD